MKPKKARSFPGATALSHRLWGLLQLSSALTLKDGWPVGQQRAQKNTWAGVSLHSPLDLLQRPSLMCVLNSRYPGAAQHTAAAGPLTGSETCQTCLWTRVYRNHFPTYTESATYAASATSSSRGRTPIHKSSCLVHTKLLSLTVRGRTKSEH